jgi:hypothetical protein
MVQIVWDDRVAFRNSRMYQNLLTSYEIACCTPFIRFSDTLLVLVLMLLLILTLIQMHQQEDVDAKADPEAGANNLQW